MLQYFFNQLVRSIGVFGRTFRAFFYRRFMGIYSRIRSLTNFSRHATSAAMNTMEGAVAMAQNPTKREDYIETKRLFISKALLLRILIAVVALGLIIYFLVWPFLLSHFLTARFYVEDKRIPDWSGKVIVYSDKKKTIPMYAGRLTDGILGGEGELYDETGLLIYEGTLVNGLQNGKGSAYKNGILKYEGYFVDGLYEGSGQLYDDQGTLIYDGQFSAGVYQGSGKQYDVSGLVYDGQFQEGRFNGTGKFFINGVMRYEGSYKDGLANGEGSSYHPNGELSYKGNFTAGEPDGQGTAYTSEGRTLYTGGFKNGLYDGDGKLYFNTGGELSATFKEGAPEGGVTWKKDGQLYYEGEWSSGYASGYGSLYGKSGKCLYTGQLSEGTLDGDWLLSRSTDELREALSEGQYKTTASSEGGFLLTSKELGLTARCSYQSADSDSRVYALYLINPGDSWVELMPGMPNVSFGANTSGNPVPADAVRVDFTPPEGVDVAAGSYNMEMIRSGDNFVTILYEDGKKEASLVSWTKAGDAAPVALDAITGADAGTDNTGEGRMNAFLDDLGMVTGDESMAATGGAAGGAGSGSSGEDNPYFGDGSVSAAVQGCDSPDKAVSLTDAMIQYWAASEKQPAYEENLSRAQLLLADAQAAQAQGTGSGAAVDNYSNQISVLNNEIQKCAAARSKAQLQAQDATKTDTSQGADLSGLDVSQALVYFDPSELDANQLSLTAAAYAQSIGKDVSGLDYPTKLRGELLDLSNAYADASLAASQYRSATAKSQSAAGKYATGAGTKEEWYGAMSDQAAARADLTEKLAAFARIANQLNGETGGFLTSKYGWMSDSLGPVFQKAIDDYAAEQKAAEEAAEAERKAAEEAAEAERKASEEAAAAASATDNGATADAAADNSATGTAGGSAASGDTGNSAASGDGGGSAANGNEGASTSAGNAGGSDAPGAVSETPSAPSETYTPAQTPATDGNPPENASGAGGGSIYAPSETNDNSSGAEPGTADTGGGLLG